jgi:hypothetical protein
VWNARRRVRHWVKEPTRMGAMTVNKWRLGQLRNIAGTQLQQQRPLFGHGCRVLRALSMLMASVLVRCCARGVSFS